MSLPDFLHVSVLALALVSAECSLFNVTFTTTKGVYTVQSPYFPRHAPAYSNVIWELSSPPNTKVALSCTYINFLKKRIVGGRETLVNEYVFPVSIKYYAAKEGFCGGSIITNRHILTAAHCVYGITEPIQVVVGEHDFNSESETNVKEIISVSQIIKHEQYDQDETTNDIAILVSSWNIEFNDFVGPVCLPNEHYNIMGQYLKVLGWGRTSTYGKHSNTLQKVDLKVIPLEVCAARYSNVINLRNPTQICTFAHQKDSCQGDSGGPLIYHDSTLNKYVQVGIVSYGKGCASSDPAVNTNVFPYFNWIQEAIQRSEAPNAQTCEKI